ncbi:MAG: Tn3 family transposase [Anaerolineae bacterium]|nr:Tn3 family transposase [Anaerolineae bacterium]
MPVPDSRLPFVGRLDELMLLKRFYGHGWHRGAGFLLLYGRKGVGKTRLLQQFLQKEAVTDYFYWQAPPVDGVTQLREFSHALLHYDLAQTDPPSPDFTFFSWREALDYLAQIAQRSPVTKLFILEGFTELCHQSEGLSSYFQHAWDHRLKEIVNLRLIITGSHVSTMIREVLAYSAPLYFRANANLHLKPLPYTALLNIFPDRSVEERMAINAITGGVPAYLSYFAQTPDLPTAVERLCFAPDSPFLADMDTLFNERLEEPVLCRAILEALSDGPAAPESLSHRVGIPYDDLPHHLYFLRLLKLIEDNRSVHDSIASMRIRHTLAEPALYFYYQHLMPALNQPSPRETAAAAWASLNEALGQTPFRALCREWIWAAVIMQKIDILPQKVGAYWGTGKAAIADGTHYELYENNLLGERHIRYGGYGGIAYHHISDTYVALFSHFIACGVWEAVYILDGLLKNKSVLQPDTVHGDTQGQSEAVFGLAHLLGIKLMPRMRNWNKVSMYRPGRDVTFEHIDAWFSRYVNWQLIEDHWQDLMQVVLSIHIGKLLPSWLLQKLNTDSPKNKLYLAFRELGRVIRTMFLLEFVSDTQLRREVRAATTKIESYNDFSQWITFGGDGILKSRDPVENEKVIKYKDLIANAIMLQNVVDMTDVLHDMAQEGYAVTADVVATFSPYLREHIKRFGEYVIDLETIPPPLEPDKPFLTPEETGMKETVVQ